MSFLSLPCSFDGGGSVLLGMRAVLRVLRLGGAWLLLSLLLPCERVAEEDAAGAMADAALRSARRGGWALDACGLYY